MMTACTDSTDPIAQPTPSASTTEQADGEPSDVAATPTESDGSGVGTELAVEDAQALLDDTIEALNDHAGVRITSRSKTPNDTTRRTSSTTTNWATRQDAWTSRTHYVNYIAGKKVSSGSTQIVAVNGRQYIRWETHPGKFSKTWFDITNSWFDRTNALEGGRSKRWEPLGELEAVTVTSARTVGKWTTVIGTVPNEVALETFGLTSSTQSMGVADRMNEGETRVFLQLSKGSPVVLSMRGINTNTPGAELPPTYLKDLRGSYYEATYAPTTIAGRITVPTPHRPIESNYFPPSQNG